MSEQPGILRSMLKEKDPALYHALEQSWQIAFDWWLHAVDVKQGSSNSAPHLRNVERHLDDILVSFERLPNTAYKSRLSPAEIYILLSAALFHDIGRTQPEREPETHGEAGARFIRQRYAHLGIRSIELAYSLAHICLFHNPPKTKKYSDMLDTLSATSIEPYGRIREPFIASLLLLADCMDASYTRALPYFLTEPGDIPVVGRFRRGIRGVYIDSVACMVRTTLTSDSIESAENSSGKSTTGESTELTYVIAPEKDRKETWDALAPNAFDVTNTLFLDASKNKEISMVNEELRKCLEKFAKSDPNKKFEDETGDMDHDTWVYVFRRLQKKNSAAADDPVLSHRILQKNAKTINLLLSLGLLRLKPTDKDQGMAFPPQADLAVAIGDLLSNGRALDQVTGVLAAEGIMLKAWVIERDMRLFNTRGELTFEPILTKDFLDRVVGGMWSLSSAVFATSRFSYEDLAAHIGEPDVRRVACAVRRIANLKPKNAKRPWIETGEDSWEWGVGGYDAHTEKTRCIQYGPSGIAEVMSSLDSPNAGL